MVGLESLNTQIYSISTSNSGKHQRLHKYPEYIAKIQSHGIGVQGAFVVGFDEDDVSTFATLADFILRNHLYAITVAMLTPYPGTRLLRPGPRRRPDPPTEWENYTELDGEFRPKKDERGGT